MLPGHCKDVAVKRVDFELSPENIEREIQGKKAYTRCDHYILRNGANMAVIEIVKAEGKDLFRPIIEHRILSLPKDVKFIENDTVDVINPSAMARVAEQWL